MAQMSVDGLDLLVDDFAALASLPDGVMDDMLGAGADIIVPAQRTEIQQQWNGPYSMGVSAKSVKKGKVKRTSNGRALEIYPQGKRKRNGKSVRNAEIAFLNEYGAPRRGIAARPAVGTATAKKEQEAVEAGEKVFHTYLDSKNL